MLGPEDCFERIISFETLNPSYKLDTSDNKDGSDQPSSKGIFDFYEYISKPDPDVVLPKTPVVCKPFQDSYEKVFKMADIDPKKTVRSLVLSWAIVLPWILLPVLSSDLTFVMVILQFMPLIIFFLMICNFIRNQIIVFFAFAVVFWWQYPQYNNGQILGTPHCVGM